MAYLNVISIKDLLAVADFNLALRPEIIGNAAVVKAFGKINNGVAKSMAGVNMPVIARSFTKVRMTYGALLNVNTANPPINAGVAYLKIAS